MKRFWYDHCKTPAAKKEFNERLAYTQDMFLILKDRLKKDLNTAQTSRRSIKSYATQSYSAYQADCNATERTLLEIIDLLPLIGENK
jgi:hypothetical protein